MRKRLAFACALLVVPFAIAGAETAGDCQADCTKGAIYTCTVPCPNKVCNIVWEGELQCCSCGVQGVTTDSCYPEA